MEVLTEWHGNFDFRFLPESGIVGLSIARTTASDDDYEFYSNMGRKGKGGAAVGGQFCSRVLLRKVASY